jgi:predicted Holliday junction resolvase-like endonuclease
MRRNVGWNLLLEAGAYMAIDRSAADETNDGRTWNEYRLMILNELRRMSDAIQQLTTEVREMKTAVEVQKKDVESLAFTQEELARATMRLDEVNNRVLALEAAEKLNGEARKEVQSLSKKAYALVVVIGLVGPKLLDYIFGLLLSKN